MRELRWGTDLDLFGAECADAEEELEQDILHVIEQDKGSNGDDPDRGLGVANVLSSEIPANFAADAERELAQDDRVAQVRVTLEINDVGGPADTVATMSASIQPSDDVLAQLNIEVPFASLVTSKA